MKSLQLTFFAILMATITFTSCKKDDDGPATSPDDITADFYFYAKINGEEVLLQKNICGYGETGGTYQDSNYFLATYTIIAKTFSLRNGSFGMSSIYSGNFHPDKEDKMLRFKLGPLDYGAQYWDTLELEGALVDFTDGDGTYWTSDLAFGDQNGSSFRFTEVDTATGTSDYDIIISAEFNCTLYDENGNSMKLTDGRGRGGILFR